MIILVFLLSMFLTTEAVQSPVTVGGLQIQLIGGSKVGEGRVEIRLDASHTWGTVCDDFWGDADATVVCSMFGYTYGSGLRYASFGKGSGPIYMDNVQCRGDEPVLTNCSYAGWEVHNCRHYEDAGASCYNHGVQLVSINGAGSDVGAVEIRELDGWKQICDSLWDDKDAKVVCKQLGFVDGKAMCCSSLSTYTYDRWNRGISYTNYSCAGTEQSLSNCGSVRDNHACGSTNGGRGSARHRASAVCYTSTPATSDLAFAVSMMNGSVSGLPAWGMLKVKHLGKWGVSCARNWNDSAANVACKQMGLGGVTGGIALGASSYRLPLPSWVSQYNCSGSESSLENCIIPPWGRPARYCRPNSLMCYGGQPPTIRLAGSGTRSGRVEIIMNGQVGTICDNSWSNNDARVVCRMLNFVDGIALKGSYYNGGTGSVFLDRMYCNGRESSIFACGNRGWGMANTACADHTKDASVVCYNEVRLQLGDHSHGIVQIKNTRYGYTSWVPLCGSGFGNTEATVVCREMGFQHGTALSAGAYGRYYSWRGYVRNNITCTGSEMSILNCTYASPRCYSNARSNYASVACYNGTLANTTSVTLEGGPTEYASKTGRVVITKNGVPGRICGQYWDDVDASVVCKQLNTNFRGGVTYQYFKRGTGPFWLSELGCFGNETSVFQCPIGPESCLASTYYKAAGALCYSSRRAPYLSLVGGTASSGRVQITYDSEVGFICADRYFYRNTAKVICKQLGYSDGTATTSSTTGGVAFMDSPYCQGYETSIFQCGNQGWRSKATCNKQAEVICYQHIKLMKGKVTTTTAQGQVQLFYQNSWAVVCGTMFDVNEATVACRELGYSFGKTLPIGAFGSQYVYWRSRLTTVGGFNCTGSEASLANCSFNAAPRNCRRDYPFSNYASLSCSKTRFNTGFTVSVGDKFPSDVTVKMYGINGSICSDGWDDREAKVMCRELGYQSGIAIGPQRWHYYHYYSGVAPRLLSNFNCTGSENRLLDCPYSTSIPSTCTQAGTTSKARVYCFDSINAVSLSLTGSMSSNQGVVSITINNRVGTICGGTSFSSTSAKVICKQLGYLDGTVQPNSQYTNGTGFAYLYQPACDGTEINIWNCKNRGWNVTYPTCLSHSGDVRVICTGYVRLQPNIQFGAVQLFDPSVQRYGLVCADNFTDVDATVTCGEMGFQYGISVCCSAFGYQYYRLAYSNAQCNGREASLANCSISKSLTYCPSLKYASVACSNIAPNSGYNLQISTSNTATRGRVRVSHMGIWGYVCPDSFDDNAANVICKMKGFTGGFAYMFRNYYRFMVRDMRWLTNIQCDGTESSLNRCGGMVWGDIKNCSRYGDAAVYCYQTSGLQVRLNGTKRGYGRVEVAIDGVWGRMCSSYYSYNNAGVVCRQMGFSGGNSVSSRTRGTGKVQIRSIYCRGGESTINQCAITWGSTRVCRDLNVQCYGKVRLRGYYRKPNYGRVEMKLQDAWVPVCDDQFTDQSARVVCKELGYVDGKKRCCSAIGILYRNKANITVTSCTGTEGSLTECQYTPGVCSTGKYVTVLCANAPITAGSMRVNIQRNRYRGAVNANKYGFYGRICDSSWTDADANVTCKQTGRYIGGVAVNLYSYSTDPMVLGGFNCTGQENNLDDCTVKGFDEDKGCEYTVNYRKAAAVMCYNSGGVDIRITNGTSSKSGRIEIKYGTIWGRVCQSYNSNNVASVACQQAGYMGGFADRSTYTPIQTPIRRTKIWMNRLRCRGTESTLFRCRHTWQPRTYFRSRCTDLGVACYGDIRLTNGNHKSTGSLQVYANGNWGSVCDHRWSDFNTKVACKQLGYDNGIRACCSAYGNHPSAIMENVQCSGTESRLQDCQHDNPHTPHCYQHNIALVCYKGNKPTTYTWKLGGGNNYTGEVLVDYLGTTGRICSDGWDDNDARVVCKSLGFRNGTAYNHVRFDYYYAAHGPFWLSNMACSGTERDLTACSMSATLGSISSCSSGKAAGVLCSDISGIYYRIAGGSQDNLGRVEVSVNGVWGSVCAYSFDNNEANVVCRTLGYSDGRSQRISYPNPPGPTYASTFQCTGDEKDLNSCPHQGWKTSTWWYCRNHRNDAAVVCYDKVRLASGFGPGIKQGPVQYYNNGTWNLICDTNFNDLSAKRFCQDIGFFDGKAICCSAYGQRYFWNNGGHRISNMSMACTGSEKSSMDCLQPTICDSQTYASAVCFNDTDVITEDYRFAFDNPTDTSGRIDVYHYGVKGRICNTFWNDADAKVYCKKRGFPDGISYHSSRWTWTSVSDRGPFWTSAINCTGTEPALLNCSKTERLSLGNCSQADVAAAACFNDTTGIKYRLADGDKRQGRVEISVGGVWGTVCDLFWDNREAGVMCRQLGYSDGYAVRGAYYGEGSGPIWLSRIRCAGTEALLHQCPHAGFNSEVVDGTRYNWYKCKRHADDASVVCVDKLRLNLGLNATMGAVEVYVGTSWVGVCSDGFDDNAAGVVCRTMGFHNGIKLVGSSFGRTAGPIGVTGVKCTAVQKTFSQCIQTFSRNCPSGATASVYCSDDDIIDHGFKMRIVPDTKAGNSGSIQVHMGGIWGSVCMAGIDNAVATVACRQFNYAGGIPYTPSSRDKNPIVMSDVRCNGNEGSLKDCSYTSKSKSNWCDYYAPRAGVLCYNDSVSFNLAGDKDPSRGRLEMTVDGQVGAFCNPHFDSRVGRVICKQRGFVDGITVSGNNYRVPDTEPLWFTHIHCFGNESSITQCDSDGFNGDSFYRGYFENWCRSRVGPVSVQCYKQAFKLSKLRLANGDTSSGRVEVFLEGPNLWGTVCDDYWSDIDATVVCNQLGFATGTAVKRAQIFGQGTGPIWLDNVACTGKEMNLKDCPSNGFSVHNCLHTEDAGVICKGVYVPPTTTIIPPTGKTNKYNPITQKITSGGSDSGGNAAAISIPIVLIIVVAAAVVGFFYYRRVNRFKDLREELVSDGPRLGGVSLRPSGAFFSKFKLPTKSSPSSSTPSVDNPSYEFAQPSTFSSESDT